MGHLSCGQGRILPAGNDGCISHATLARDTGASKDLRRRAFLDFPGQADDTRMPWHLSFHLGSLDISDYDRFCPPCGQAGLLSEPVTVARAEALADRAFGLLRKLPLLSCKADSLDMLGCDDSRCEPAFLEGLLRQIPKLAKIAASFRIDRCRPVREAESLANR